jgi:hypothetical protein
MTPDFVLGEMVATAVMSANELSDGFKRLLELPTDVFVLPREVIEQVILVMSTNAMLNTKLFEQNQSIMENIEQLVKEHLQK